MTAMMRTVLMAVVLMASFVLASGRPDVASAQVSPSQQPLFTGGFLPVKGGVGLIVFVPGGSMLKLAGAAQIEGCSLEAVWVSSAGTFSTYIYKAPAFVNEPFLKAIPNGELPANSPVLVRCGKPPITETQGSDTPIYSLCDSGVSQAMQDRVLSRMPVPAGICIVRFNTIAEAEQFLGPQSAARRSAYDQYGGYAFWRERGNLMVFVGTSHIGRETHEMCHANQTWVAATSGHPLRWDKTEMFAEFIKLGQWKHHMPGDTWTSIGLERIEYKPNPAEAAAEVCRIVLNPEGWYTQAEIDALVPAVYQQWVQKWVIVR